jgi:hypothetical protein
LFDHGPFAFGLGTAISSAPGLAAVLRRSHRWLELPSPLRTLLRGDPLVQMYRVPAEHGETLLPVEEEAQAAAHVLLAVADRLRRLSNAYGEWREFDPSAYFDLTDPQAARLVRVVERVTTVHVTFFADLLLPSFQVAEAYWQEQYRRHYRALRAELQHGPAETVQLPNGRLPPAPVMDFVETVQPQMVAHWRRLLAVLRQTRGLVSEELGFWAAGGGGDERARWRWAWQAPPPPGVDPALLPDLADVPTLTLAVDFPLPAARQPGRLRRLRRSREHGRIRHRAQS